MPLGGDYWKGSQAPSGALWGFADLHSHPMNADGFGGNLYAGKLSGPIETALGNCAPQHGKGLLGKGSFSISPEMSHKIDGFPLFDGWPKRSTLIHQQMHADWIHRAFLGGLRVIHADMGNSLFLASEYEELNKINIGSNPLPSTDPEIIPIEIKALNAFLNYSSSWAGIAHNASELHSLVQQGKLAVVLGAELDSPDEVLGVKNYTGPPEGARPIIQSRLKSLYDSGLRHLFGIHLINSRFGGSGVYSSQFNYNNYYTNGEFFNLTNGWDEGIRYRMDLDETTAEFLIRIVAGLPKPSYPNLEPPFSHMNADGLSPLGVILYQEMMKLGMLIDVSHQSTRSKNDTLTLCEAIGYPCMASHTRPRAVQFGYGASVPFERNEETYAAYNTSAPTKICGERALSDSEIKRIAALNGIVGSAIATPAVASDQAQNCDGSSKGFYRSFSYLESIMGRGAVCFGTDTNGFAGVATPRFGPQACRTAAEGGDDFRKHVPRAQASLQRRGVLYRTNITDAGKWRFDFSGDAFPYSDTQRDVWAAAARFVARVDFSVGTKWEQHVSEGFNASASGLPLSSVSTIEAQASWLAYQCVTCNQTFGGSVGHDIRLVWERWLEVLAENNAPLERMTLGESERDINFDGQVTYGMLPDLLQDTVNHGGDVSGIFQSSERYYNVMRSGEKLAQLARKFFP